MRQSGQSKVRGVSGAAGFAQPRFRRLRGTNRLVELDEREGVVEGAGDTGRHIESLRGVVLWFVAESSVRRPS